MTVPPLFFMRAREENSRLRRWLLACLLTGLTILGARLSAPVPGTPIPITFQVFGVLLSGLLLGSRWGSVAMAQYLLLGWMGLPVFALGKSGFAPMFGLTGGYLWSYPLAAFVVGWLAERSGRSLRGQLLACAAGLAVIYGLGCTWFALVSHQSFVTVLLQGALVFLAWDVLKALAAVAATRCRTRRG